MRTKLVTAALATLLTVGSTAVALAQAADTIATTNRDVMSDQIEASQTTQQQNSSNFTVHAHPHNGNVW